MLYVTNPERTQVQVVECRSRETRWCPLDIRRNPKGHVLGYDVKLQAQDLSVRFDVRGRSKLCPHWALVATALGPEGTAAALRREMGYVPGPLPEPPPYRARRGRRKAPDARQLDLSAAMIDGGNDE